MKNELNKSNQDQVNGKGAKIFVVSFAVATLFFIILTIYLTAPGVFTLDYFRTDNIPTKEWVPKDVEMELASGTMPEAVEYGYRLLVETPKYLGPQAIDPEMRFSGNNLSCASCHLKAGNQAGSASWAGVTERFPAFGGRSNSIGTIEDRINGCLERSMNGRKVEIESEEMKAMVAYMEWLAEDMPEDKMDYYTGFTDLKIPDVAVDLDYGKQIYGVHCVACHQQDGLGIKNPDFSLGYLFPPISGEDSYNDGAGMHRVLTAAAFIKANMPSEIASKENPVLTDEEAYHVAGYINSLKRPAKNNKEADFPDRKLKPVSTPYGPWEDDFSAEQHKYGPFPPIIDFYKDKYGIIKTK